MAQDETSSMAHPIAWLAVVVAVAVFLFRFSQGEAAFCRRVFAGLVRGDQSVQSRIDWAHFKALDIDVGAAYSQFPDDRQKAQYRQAFIAKFAEGFNQGGARLENFTKWRVQGGEGGRRIVAADYPAKQKTLLFQIPAGWHKRLEAIQWQ